MKRMVLLLLCMLLLTTGCYDYSELDERAIVNAIAIDKVDDNYLVTFEVLVNKKDSDVTTGMLFDGTHKTISGAFKDVTTNIAKKVYLEHIEVIVASEEIVTNDFEEILSYLIREPKINKDFHLIIANGCQASEILDSATKDEPVVGEMIIAMLNHDSSGANITTNLYYEDIYAKILDYGKDGYFTSISKEDDKIKLDGFAILNNFKLAGFLTKDESIIFNILSSNSTNATIDYIDDTKTIVIKSYKTKSKTTIKNNKIIMTTQINAYLIENTPNNNQDIESFYEIEELFEKIITQKINSFFQTIKKANSDILGINYQYYKTTKYKKDIWKELDYDIEVKITINKKSLTHEVKT